MSKDTEYTTENLLEDGCVDFNGATLQMHPDDHGRTKSPNSLADDSDSVAKLSLSPDLSGNKQKDDDSLKPAVSSGADVVSPIISLPKRISQTLRQLGARRAEVACQLPALGEDEARYFFSSRGGLVDLAVRECASQLVVPEVDGALVGSWLLTEISLWDHEKERLVLLTAHALFTVKYDFIALRQLEHRRVPLCLVDTLVVGDLVYPSGSLVPRLNGLAAGVTSAVKGCLLRPLQQRWARGNDPDKSFCPSAFDYITFEPRARNTRGVRVLWNHRQPLGLGKKWNPFSKEIPFTTYTSHPLFWHKGAATEAVSEANQRYDVDDFARSLVSQVETACDCRIEHRPVVLENYLGLGSLVHNRNELGFFKVRGKFSF
ncbi:tumor protein p63-regulated gene 1-like protein isoform X1 [Bacillus rossius redtenbacheri]|uniref:tumor protein p63-regulated gene 1-like protein isoform X1 n=1 Tax=Bacillus rossius redtenbacheri TaxID=93214 RepID=UPI002FDDB19E